MWRKLPACDFCLASWKLTPLIHRTIPKINSVALDLLLEYLPRSGRNRDYEKSLTSFRQTTENLYDNIFVCIRERFADEFLPRT
jgi:hypothetical protein